MLYLQFFSAVSFGGDHGFFEVWGFPSGVLFLLACMASSIMPLYAPAVLHRESFVRNRI